eukprot:1157543-Pelagomonas_calceolata.AAC.4
MQIQALQDARQAALLDAELQLRLKAGQLEVGLSSGSKEAGGLLAGTADAMFVHRSVVEALNEQIRQRVRVHACAFVGVCRCGSGC